MSVPTLQQQGWRTYTPETMALCKQKAAAANSRGRAQSGQSWAPDIEPCGMACPTCIREVVFSGGEARHG